MTTARTVHVELLAYLAHDLQSLLRDRVVFALGQAAGRRRHEIPVDEAGGSLKAVKLIEIVFELAELVLQL